MEWNEAGSGLGSHPPPTRHKRNHTAEGDRGARWPAGLPGTRRLSLRKKPMMSGPKYPPKFASELIMAMPAAADRPAMLEVAIAQKGPTIAFRECHSQRKSASPR